MRQTRSQRLIHRLHLVPLLGGLLFAPWHVGPALAAPATASDTMEFHIKPQPLDKALVEFSVASRSQVVADGKLSAGAHSPGVQGRYSPREALEQLLRDSGLSIRSESKGTFTLQKSAVQKASPQGAAPSSDSTTLPKITVTDTVGGYEVDDPYNHSYIRYNATTATKTDTPWIETPVSIQVIPRSLMDDTQTVRLKDALQYVSGVSAFSPAGSFDYDNFVIRGFYDYNLTSIYRNGLQTRRAAFEPSNLERLEVLKGPSTVLYGRTEPGGMINRVTKMPLDKPYYALSQQFGSFDHYRSTVDLTGPIDPDKKWLYRFNAAYQDTDSFVDINHQERFFVAPALTFRISPDTEFFLNAEYKRDRQRYYDGIPIIGDRPAPIRTSTYLGFGGANEYETLENGLLESGFTHRVNHQWSLRGRYHHQWFNYKFNTYFSNGLLPDNRTLERGTYYNPYDVNNVDQANFDIIGKLDGGWAGKHEVLFGFDWHRYTTRQSSYCCTTPGPLRYVDIYQPTYGPYPDVIPNSYNTSDERWYGIYLQDQISLGEDWHVLLGGRYDWADNSSRFSSTSFSEESGKRLSEERFNPRFGVVYDITDDWAVYASYSEAFSASNGRGFAGTSLQPQTAQQWETGLKAQAFNGQLTGTLAFYELTKQNLTGPDPAHFGFQAAIGEARSRGIELDINARIDSHWNLIGTYSFTDAVLTKNYEGNEGNRLLAVPKNMGSLWLKYDFVPDGESGLSLAVGSVFAGQREVDYANSAQLPGYGRLDMAASYRLKFAGQTYTANFNINNLLDKTYYESGGYSRAGVFPAAPRSFMGSIKLEF